MEYFENTLCVDTVWLCDEAGIMTRDNLRQLSSRGKARIVRRGGGKDTPVLAAFESLPDRFKNAIREVVGDPYENVVKTEFEKYIVDDEKLRTYLFGHRLPDGSGLKAEKAICYYNEAIILKACGIIMSDRRVQRKMLGNKTRGIWDTISNQVNDLDKKKYPHSLPALGKTLKRKYLEFDEGGFLTLIHGGYGNSNTRKVTGDLERLILSIYCQNNKPYASWVHDDYMAFLAGVKDIVDMETGELFDRENFFDEKKGSYITLSDITCWNYINLPKNDIIVQKFRSTPHQYLSTIRPHVHRHAPNFSLSKISLDDRDLPRKTHDGNRIKAYYAYDVTSGCLIGASYSLKKDANLFIECIQNMLRFLDMNGYGTPMEMEVEHHLVSLFKDDLMKAGVVFPFVRWCAPSNSQEKAAEGFNRQKKYGYEKRYQDGIGRFYLKLQANQTGGERVYDDKVDKYVIKEQTYSYADLVADDIKSIDRYNNGLHRNQKMYKGKTRRQVLEENLNPNLVEINRPLLIRFIGKSTTTSIKRNMYCQVQYNNYMLPDPDVLDKLSPNNYNVQAYYMPEEDIQDIYLYQNDEFIATCHKIKTFNTSQAETTQEDLDAKLIQDKYMAKFDAKVKKGKASIANVSVCSSESLNEYDYVAPIIKPKRQEIESDDIDFTVFENMKQRALSSL